MTNKAKVCLLLSLGFASVAAVAQPPVVVVRDGYFAYENGGRILMHVTRHANKLSFLFDTARALGYTISDDGASSCYGNVITVNTPYAGPFFQQVLLPMLAPAPITAAFTPGTQIQNVDRLGGFFRNGQLIGKPYDPNALENRELEARKRNVDGQMGAMIAMFARQSLYTLDQWRRKVKNPKSAINFPKEFKLLQYFYLDAEKAALDYVVAEHAISLARNCPKPAQNPDQLRTRLKQILWSLAALREVMYAARLALPFRLQLPTYLIEPSYPSVLVDVDAAARQPFVDFPFVVEESGTYRQIPPQNYRLQPRPVQGNPPAPSYNFDQWEENWNNGEDIYREQLPRDDGRGPYVAPGGTLGGVGGNGGSLGGSEATDPGLGGTAPTGPSGRPLPSTRPGSGPGGPPSGNPGGRPLPTTNPQTAPKPVPLNEFDF